MKLLKEVLNGVKVFELTVFGDDRGYFTESFNQKAIEEHIGAVSFFQDNQSKSSKGVLRGLHFQNPPFAQGKLVRVLQGSVLDVVVDIRKDSPSYGQVFKQELSADKFNMIWVPPGFAHGFVTLEDETVFFYKVTNYYNKESEGSIRWDDPDLNIDWGIKDPILAEKDASAPSFKGLDSLF